MVPMVLLLPVLLVQGGGGGGGGGDGGGRTLTFSAPSRVYPRGNETARTFGALYADAFYAMDGNLNAARTGGEPPVLFGVPGVIGNTTVNNHAVLSTDGGQSWRPWYPARYIDPRTGYPFTAVPNLPPKGYPKPRTAGATATPGPPPGIHDLGNACSSRKGTPQRIFANDGSVGSWAPGPGGAAGPVGPSHRSVAATVSFSALPVPLNCTEGGATADCFWLHAGGTVALPVALGGGLLMTNCVPWLHGRFGATAAGAGVFAWHSTDGFSWNYRGTVITAAQIPVSGEGPNENDVALLADGVTLLSVFRVDDGVDGGAVGAKNYRSATSIDGGRTWSAPTEMIDIGGRGIGVARPRLLMLGGDGPLLLSGGRLYTEHTRDILLWVCWDGMGRRWEPHSVSYQHNLRVAPAALRFDASVNATTGRATTSYTSLLRLGVGRACLVYNGDTGIFAMEIGGLRGTVV